MRVEQVDDRGYVKSFQAEDKEYLLIFTKSGAKRGGHKHDYKQVNYLLSGKVSIDFGDCIGNYESPDMIVIEPNQYHLFISVTDSLMIEDKN